MASRALPRPFTYHWGSGRVIEEVAVDGEHKEAAIQLLEYDDGTLNVRFCFYDDSGRFQRNPLLVDETELDRLAVALRSSLRLRELLRRLVA